MLEVAHHVVNSDRDPLLLIHWVLIFTSLIYRIDNVIGWKSDQKANCNECGIFALGHLAAILCDKTLLDPDSQRTPFVTLENASVFRRNLRKLN